MQFESFHFIGSLNKEDAVPQNDKSKYHDCLYGKESKMFSYIYVIFIYILRYP